MTNPPDRNDPDRPGEKISAIREEVVVDYRSRAESLLPLSEASVVVDDNEVLPVKPGQPIRYPVEAEGRHVDLSVDEWLREYTINVGHVPVDDTGAGQQQ